jgi:D-tyrosyl-tRNA(Tyr) deacylase
MRTVIQRVARASVNVSGKAVSEIGAGLLALIGVARDDAEQDAEYLAQKIAGLRIFPDQDGKMNRTVSQAGGAILVVSQFTLLGDCRRGRRPSFDRAAPPERAMELYNYLVSILRRTGIAVETGVFQAHMDVSLVNQGPVTIWIDSEERLRE